MEPSKAHAASMEKHAANPATALAKTRTARRTSSSSIDLPLTRHANSREFLDKPRPVDHMSLLLMSAHSGAEGVVDAKDRTGAAHVPWAPERAATPLTLTRTASTESTSPAPQGETTGAYDPISYSTLGWRDLLHLVNAVRELEEQVRVLNGQCTDLGDQLSEEAEWRRSAEKEAETLRNALSRAAAQQAATAQKLADFQKRASIDMQRHAEQSAQHASLTRELKTMLEAETRKAAAAEAASVEAKERLSIGQEEMERAAEAAEAAAQERSAVYEAEIARADARTEAAKAEAKKKVEAAKRDAEQAIYVAEAKAKAELEAAEARIAALQSAMEAAAEAHAADLARAQADGDAKALAAMEELRERNRLEMRGMIEEHDKRLMEHALERMGLSLLALRPLLYGWAKAVKRDKRKRTAILRWRDNQTWRLLDAWRDFSEEKRATRKLHVVAMVWSQEYALNICMQKWRAVITSLAYTFVRQKDLAERASKSLRTLIFYSRGGDLFSTWAMYAALRSRVYALMAIGTSGYVESRWRQGWLAFVAVAVEAHAVRRWERQRLSLAWAAWLERWVGTLKGRWRRGEQVMDQAERRRRRDSLGVGSPSLLELS